MNKVSEVIENFLNNDCSILPLSFSQEGLWLLQQFYPKNLAFNILVKHRMEGNVSYNAIHYSINKIVQRHQSLRTIFRKNKNGEPVQIVLNELDIDLPLDDISMYSESEKKTVCEKIIFDESQFIFDLENGPLIRAKLICINEKEHILLTHAHHMVFDGWSTNILKKELALFYNLYIDKAEESFPELEFQYSDYVMQQQEILNDDDFKDQCEYWKYNLKGVSGILQLPYDNAKNSSQSFDGDRIRFKVEKDLMDKIKSICKQEKCTLFTILLSAFKVLLCKITGENDIVVGVPASDRMDDDFEDSIGFFVNTIPLRSNISKNKLFNELLDEVRTVTSEAFSNINWYFHKYLNDLDINTNLNSSPLIQTMFNLRNFPRDEVKFSDLKVVSEDIYNNSTKYDLTLIIDKIDDGNIEGWFDYNCRLFNSTTIKEYINNYKYILNLISKDVNKQIKELCILNEKEEAILDCQLNNFEVSKEFLSVHKRFEKQVELNPDKKAIIYGNEFLTYRLLNERVNKLAHYLIDCGVKKNSIVGICIERSFDMVISLLAVLKSGGAYLPIDHGVPEDRLKNMINDIHFLLTKSNIVDNMRLPIEKIVLIDNDKDFWVKKKIMNPNVETGLNDLAYVIHTSGSTGKPKGAANFHKGFINLVEWYIEEYKMDENTKMLLVTTICFDLAQKNVYAPLIAGGELHLLQSSYFDIIPTVEDINKYKINIINCTPSIFCSIVDTKNQEVFKKISSLKYVILGGEPIKLSYFNFWRKSGYFNAEITNSYGPSECSDVCTFYRVNENDFQVNNEIPVGKPIKNTCAFILDEENNLLPPGRVGEICLAGECIGRGYINDDRLTNEKFITNNIEKIPGERIYRTGDLGKLRIDGNIEYCGRSDFQVKIRGIRIELGEIETVIESFPEVQRCVIITYNNNSIDKIFVAYIKPKSFVFSLNLLNSYLKDKLPDYMLPSEYVIIDEFVLNVNGKIDRNALPKPNFSKTKRYEAPKSKTESLLAEIWANTLKIDQRDIGINDNFFEIGGHSLNANILIMMIQDKLDVSLSLVDIFNNPTISELSIYISKKALKKKVSIPKAELHEYYPASSVQQRLCVLQMINPESTFYNMPLIYTIKGELEVERIEKSINYLMDRHDILKTTFFEKDGKYYQKVNRDLKLKINYIKIDNDNYDKLIRSYIQPFNILKAPLLRVNLFEIENQYYVLMLDIHHLISDGISNEIIIDELGKIYNSDNLDDVVVQYKDFCAWQEKTEQMQIMKTQEKYWLDQYKRELSKTTLPLDFVRPSNQSYKGSRYYFELDNRTKEILTDIAKKEQVTLYSLMLSIFNIFISKVSRCEDIVIGTPTSGRTHPDILNTIGMFANTLALRNFPKGSKKFKDFLVEVHKNIVKALENQDYPFENLVEKVVSVRDIAHNPIFDVMFSFNQIDEVDLNLSNMIVYPYTKDRNFGVARFDLFLLCLEDDDKFSLCFEYCTDLFKEDTIIRFSEYFKQLVHSIINGLDFQISNLVITPVSDNEKILYDFNKEYEFDDKKLTLELFNDMTLKFPNDLAVVLENNSLTYKELNEKSNRLAWYLKDKGVEKGLIVGIMIERSLDVIISMLAILKTGAAYLPIDIEYPSQRVMGMLEDSDVKFIISKQNIVERFPIIDLKKIKLGRIEPYVTNKRKQILNLDKLEIPDRSLIDYSKYHDYIGISMARYSVSVQATRGCPYNCAFCHKIWPKTHIVRSAEHIFDEVKRYYDAGVKRITFIDDIFNLDSKNVERFFNKIVQCGMKLQMFFPNGLRGDILTEEFIDMMVEGGAVDFNLALESASPRIQKLISKNVNLDRLESNINYLLTKHPHVITEIELMTGFPTETEDEALMTLEYLSRLKWIDFPILNFLKVFPNTDIYNLAIKNGVSKRTIENSINLGYHELPDTLPFSKDFAREYQAKYMNEYFLNKDRMIYALKKEMKVLTEKDIIQKYNSYIPGKINDFHDILKAANISDGDIGEISFVSEESVKVDCFSEQMEKYSLKKNNVKEPMRILLLDLSQFFNNDNKSHLYEVVEPPLGLMYLMSNLNKAFQGSIEGKVAKARIDFNNYDDLKTIISDFKPDIIGIRTLSFYKNFFHDVVERIRSWGVDIPIISGGPYATSDYKFILQDPNVDLVVLGEGEDTLNELVEKMLMNNKKLPKEEILEKISGVAFVRESEKELVKSDLSQIIYLDSESDNINSFPTDNLDVEICQEDLLYLIYTSGSTGKPKGVMLKHGNIINLLKYQHLMTNINFESVLQFASISFDVSFQEIFTTLTSGGTLYLVTEELRNQVYKLLDYIEKNNIKTVFMPPAYIKMIFNNVDSHDIPKCIEHFVTAGEQLEIINQMKEYLKYNNVFIHNHYGPTESHVVTALTIQAEQNRSVPDYPSIGNPLPNCNIYILDEAKNLLPIGIPGEIHIGGKQVAKGYYNKNDLTKNKFINDPFNNGKKAYCTGDLAQWNADGTIKFLGRIDNQIQIRGYRVELEEIESVMLEIEEIKNVCILAKNINESTHLYAYYTSNDKLESDDITRYLDKFLPDYMVPSFFIQVDNIPLTENGKVDKRALLSIEEVSHIDKTYPENPVEEVLKSIWGEVLGVSDTCTSTSFFRLGGHSLSAIQVISWIRKIFDIELSIQDLFQNNTIKLLANRLIIIESAPGIVNKIAEAIVNLEEV
jgi:amino acid adenylation domain-containing protein